jgi:hypothetical protein
MPSTIAPTIITMPTRSCNPKNTESIEPQLSKGLAIWLETTAMTNPRKTTSNSSIPSSSHEIGNEVEVRMRERRKLAPEQG